MISTIRQALDLMGRDDLRRWVLLIVLALISSGFEMLGAVLIFVLVGLAADPSAAIDLPVVGDVRSSFGGVDSHSLLLWTAAIIGAFFVVRGAVQIWITYYQRRVAEEAGAKVSVALVDGYLRSPYPFHLRRNTAELIRNSHQVGIQLVNQVFTPIINIAAQSVLTLGLLTVLAVIAPIASAFAVVSIGGAALLILLIVQPRLKHVGAVAHQSHQETLRWLQQALQGIRDIKLFAVEDYFVHRYGRSRLRLARANYLGSTLRQMPTTIIETALIGFILIFLGISTVASDQSTQALPILGLFAYVGLRLLPSIQKIVRGLNDIKYGAAAITDVHHDLEEIRTLPPNGGTSIEPLPFTKELVLKDVCYRYEESDQSALSDINLIIRPGEELGICGPTGGGKTTLIDIITGLLQPTSGRVTVDGADISAKTGQWQQNLGVVPQSVFLTDDTLRSNIALGVDDRDINEDALTEAVDLAQLSDFVESLPEGLHTVVGERGVRISGGQRQRIAIARALYQQPDVLIFDEGTSALDNVVEAALLSSLDKLRGSHTILHVAHRLSTVRRSDRVVFIESGRITGLGSYDSLATTHDGFRQMNDMEISAME